MQITVTNNVTGNVANFATVVAINLDHLAKAFDLGTETKVIPLKNGGIVVMYANGHVASEPVEGAK